MTSNRFQACFPIMILSSCRLVRRPAASSFAIGVWGQNWRDGGCWKSTKRVEKSTAVMESGYARTPSNLPVLDQPQSSDVDLLVKNSRWRSWGQNILHAQLLAQVPAVSTCSRLSRMPAYLNMKIDKIIAEEPVSSFTPHDCF